MKNSYAKIVLGIAVLLTVFALSSNAQIHSTSAGGPWDSTWTWVGGIVPTAAYDVVINGAVYSSNNACHNLTIISTGSLFNNTYSYTLTVSGNLTNNGIIQSEDIYSYLTLSIDGNIYNNATVQNNVNLNIDGDIINDGIWDNHNTSLTGSTDQHFSCINGNSFASTNFYNNKTAGNIYINTLVYFDDVQINFYDHDFPISANTTLKIHDGKLSNCNLTGEGELSILYGEGIYNIDAPEYENVSFTDLALQGENNIGSNNCSTHGTVINNGSLQNYYYNGTLNTYDEFINNGVIQDNNPYSPFIIRLYGNLTNNGSWENSNTQMVGASEQYIHLQNGNYITGQMRFVSDIQVSPYQWYWNGWAIVNPPYPQPAIFSGETSNTLIFLNPVDDNWLGTYVCNTGGGLSRNIIVDEITVGFSLDITAFLEGPFNGTSLNPNLNAILPLSQPYSGSPWNYTGTESVASIPNTNVVDWVLIELRETTGDASTATSDSIIAQQAAFILNNGSIISLDGSSNLQFSNSIIHQLFVVIWHRNHLGVMSANPLTESGGIYDYDFTTGAGQAYNFGQKDIGGVYGMYAGDGNADGVINSDDKTNVWSIQAGTRGYKSGDFDMNGQVMNQDKNDVWLGNLNEQTHVPD
ncbi:MAG: hypothetical protein K8S16_09030 [Bacteroidales bacterium]|nr:hypothetical protein [Bacteroidales bacterium]